MHVVVFLLLIATAAGTFSCLKSITKQYALVTLVSTEDYVEGANVLLYSVKKHLDSSLWANIVSVAMVIAENNATIHIKRKLIGWTVCTVPVIEPAKATDVPSKRFKQLFSKVHIFDMVQFVRVVFLDSDTLVIGDISALFYQSNSIIAWAKDWENGQIREDCNSGVMSIKPSAEEFNRLNVVRLTTRNYRTEMADQGLLNYVYAKVGEIIPFEYNGNLAAQVQNGRFWSEHRPALKIIHYTWIKPFDHDRRKHVDYKKVANTIDFWYTYRRDMIQSRKASATIVTCYYHVGKSKHSNDQYRSWFTNFFTIKSKIVLFTDSATRDEFFLRTPQNVVVVVTELDSVSVAHYDWENEYLKDREKYHSPELYIIWNEKTNFVRLAIKHKYQPTTTHYFWVDIGCFRDSEAVSDYAQWPSVHVCNAIGNRFVVLSINDFTQSELKETMPSFQHVDRIGGTIFGGSITSWFTWANTYYRVLDSYIQTGRFAGKDQSIMAQTLLDLRRSNTFEVIVIKASSELGDKWFHLQPFLAGASSDAKLLLNGEL
jgi:lipopolysaccharide biosynthesis glycosyltransferase